MFLKAKRIAFLGLLLAVAVLLIIGSGIFEVSTLFLLGGASFCVGIAIRECGMRLGVGFFIAALLLSLILAPNKVYCFTFAGMAIYLIMIELAWERLARVTWRKNRNLILWLFKFMVFNGLYVAALIFLPDLIFPGKISGGLLALLIGGGQLALIIYDQAYNYFQRSIWTKLSGYLRLGFIK